VQKLVVALLPFGGEFPDPIGLGTGKVLLLGPILGKIV
jgi:hypothetical protein